MAHADQLSKITLELSEICSYLDLNITCIRKILKKFDKKLKEYALPQALDYIKKRLSVENSALKGILSYQQILKIYVIVEDAWKVMNSILGKRSKNS